MQEKITTLLDEARKKVEGDDIQGAIALYKEVVDLNPKSEEGFMEMGNLYHQVGELSPALSAFYCVLDINPENMEAKVKLEMINSILNFYHKDRLNP